MDDFSPMPPRRGRAAADNPPNRFEPLHVVEDPAALDEDERRQVPTELLRDTSRSILARNDSPDLPFTYSLNPYRGCEHGCAYCLSGDTLILMGDGRTKPLRDVQAGDVIYGTERRGWYRRYVRTRVLDHWSTEREAYRITLADGTQITASGDHRFLTERGWKYVTGAQQGHHRRPHLTLNNALMGIGALQHTPTETSQYRQGYLCGMIRGDGHLAFYEYDRPRRQHGNQWQFRLALKDESALNRAAHYLDQIGIPTHDFLFQKATATTAAMPGIRTHARAGVEETEGVVSWPLIPSSEWLRGFLSGIFDAEGSYSGGIVRIANTDAEILDHIEKGLDRFGFDFIRDVPKRQEPPVHSVRLLGGLVHHLRFFHLIDPAIRRKVDIEGQALKSVADLQVARIEQLDDRMPMYDITTGTGDFIADGVVSHNCYARPTHEYLGFSGGLDFETKIVVKEEAPRLLDETLQKPSWKPQPILMSGATDPYQPVERKLKITRACLEVFLRHRHPVTLITKNQLVTRDLDLLQELAALDLVRVTMSITSLKDEVVGAMEPRTSRPAARLRALEQLAEAGVPVGVNAAPLIPGLTDEELPAILEAAAERGATTAGYIVVRLPGMVKPLFVDWLRRSFPDRADRVLRRLEQLRGPALNDNRFGKRMHAEGEWADLLHQLYRLSCRRHGLNEKRHRLATEHYRRLRGGQLDLF